MSEKEKKIAEKVAAAVSDMDPFTKGYLLGQVEAMAYKKEKEQQEFAEDEGGE